MSINTLPNNPTVLAELVTSLKPLANNYFNYSGAISGGSLNTFTLLNSNVQLQAGAKCLIQVSFQCNSSTGTATSLVCNATVGGVALTAQTSPSLATGITHAFYSFLVTPTASNPAVNIYMTPTSGFIGADSGLWTVSLIQ